MLEQSEPGAPAARSHSSQSASVLGGEGPPIVNDSGRLGSEQSFGSMMLVTV